MPQEELKAEARRLEEDLQGNHDGERRRLVILLFLERVYSAGYEDRVAEEKAQI